MRAQIITAVLCFAVVFMLAAPAMANHPIAYNPYGKQTDDPIEQAGVCVKIYCLPIGTGFYPVILVPTPGEPVIDEGPLPNDLSRMSNDVAHKNHAK